MLALPPNCYGVCSQISLFFLIGMNSSKTKLELQKHLTTLTNQEQATIFEEVQVQYWFLISRKGGEGKASSLWNMNNP